VSGKELGSLPAFPCPVNVGPAGEYFRVEFDGLNKREWLIGQIAKGHCANPEFAKADATTITNYSINQADSILEQLAKEVA